MSGESHRSKWIARSADFESLRGKSGDTRPRGYPSEPQSRARQRSIGRTRSL